MEDRIKSHRANSFKTWLYSVQRIDLLIVSISGAGIYVVLETLKYSIDHSATNMLLLKITGLVFILTMIINFCSQYTGERASMHEMLWCDEELDKEIAAAKIHRTIGDAYARATTILNAISMAGMFIGLVLISVYFCVTF